MNLQSPKHLCVENQALYIWFKMFFCVFQNDYKKLVSVKLIIG